MLKVKKIFVLSFMILSFVTLPLKTYAVDNVLEPTAAPVMTDTAIDDVTEPTAAPVMTDTAVDDVPKSTTAPVTTDITTETTVITTQIPTISAVVYTTPFAIYESAYVHSLKSPPDKTVYEIGDELDLTGLKVDLEFYDQQGGHRTIYRDAYPLDNPDFIVDTSDFDSSKAGTYKIKISCADKFTAFYLPGSVYFEVTVNDPSPVTTTSTSLTDITITTETTVVTTSIPIVTSISPITSLYQWAYHLDIHHLPNKTNYNIGDKLDLTGLTVDLRYNDESNIYYNTDYINAYPPDYPDVFIIDTSNFDNSKAGTYTIKISCKYEAIHWYPPSAYLKITVNDSGLVTTTTSTSSTDITTTSVADIITIPTETTPQGWYESQYEITIDSLPNKTSYYVGEQLDLSGLKVSLVLYDQHGYIHNIYTSVSPLDYPDAFVVDTANFDKTKVGTYTLKISCTDEYQSFLPTDTITFTVITTEPNKLSFTPNPKFIEFLEETNREVTVTQTDKGVQVLVYNYSNDPTGHPIQPLKMTVPSGWQIMYSIEAIDPSLQTVGEGIVNGNGYFIYYVLVEKTGDVVYTENEILDWYLSMDIDSEPITTTATPPIPTESTTTVTTIVTDETNTEQTTAPTTDAGGSVTTEISTVPPTTTAGTETTLPQTGYPKWYQSLIVVAMGMIGVGSTAIVKSGIFRKKENNI